MAHPRLGYNYKGARVQPPVATARLAVAVGRIEDGSTCPFFNVFKSCLVLRIKDTTATSQKGMENKILL